MTRTRHRTRTPELARELLRSVAGDALQSAAVLAALGGLALTHPAAGIASLAAGGAFLALRPNRSLDPLGRTREQVAKMRREFALPLGTVADTGETVELGNDDARQHMLVLGTPGESKSDYLLGLAESTIATGSGAVLVDARGDVGLWAKLYAVAKSHGREDDLLVLNFVGGAGLGPDGEGILSNTLNPFASGSSDNLTQLLVGLLPDRGRGDDAMRLGQATSMLTGLMRFLVWLRDEGRIDLHVGTIRDHLSFAALHGAADPANYPDLPEDTRRSINAYLTYLPGYNAERGLRQSQQTLEAHATVERELVLLLGILADEYGHVFAPGPCDVDMADVVLNRRILLVLLPDLGNSGGELAGLGRIVAATLKGMMGAALGNRIEGSWSEIVDNRVTNSPTPFTCILDDVSHYAVRGMALMAAQARSLGFAMVYGAPDMASFSRGNEIEGASLRANTNTKILLRDEIPAKGLNPDPVEAFEDVPAATVPFPQGGVGDLYLQHKASKLFLNARRPKALVPTGLRLRANHFLPLAWPRPPGRDLPAQPTRPEARR